MNVTTHILNDWRIENGLAPIVLPTLAEFLAACNGKARKRLFDETDYESFIHDCDKAMTAAMDCEMFCAESHAGGVANAYGSTTTTARWGVWAWPDRSIEFVTDRAGVSGPNPPKAYKGGERSYRKEFDRLLAAVKAGVQA